MNFRIVQTWDGIRSQPLSAVAHWVGSFPFSGPPFLHLKHGESRLLEALGFQRECEIRGSDRKFWSWAACVRILTLPLIGCVTVGKVTYPLCALVSYCKTGKKVERLATEDGCGCMNPCRAWHFLRTKWLSAINFCERVLNNVWGRGRNWSLEKFSEGLRNAINQLMR